MSDEYQPTEAEQRHILPLAQKIVDLVQSAALANNMTLAGVLSAIGTASGALLARAYKDPETAELVAQRLSIVASAFATAMYANGQNKLPVDPYQ